MSSSLFRHQWGTETALRMKSAGEFGPLQYVIASQGGGYSHPSLQEKSRLVSLAEVMT
ncbi:MAG: hypothetical protein JSS49_02210 [Planctomycetes bacterium]|nr:hypothetical protein [Planctomycetota bacterium]